MPLFQFDRPQQPTIYRPEVVRKLWHDTSAFTEGLQIIGEELYESTGLEGHSWIARRKLETTQPVAAIKKKTLDARYFGEGIVVVGSKLYQLTWKDQIGFIYDAKTLERTASFRYKGEGWSLTTDGKSLIMSDGTPYLRFLDPENPNVATRKPLKVTVMGNAPTGMWAQLNELEWYKGELLCNVWQKDAIYRINPQTGVVTGLIDCSGLLPDRDRTENTDVLNGIAYDAKKDKLYFTGKFWPYLYEVKLVKK